MLEKPQHMMSYANQKFKDKEGIAGQWEANFQGKVCNFVKIKEIEQWKKMFIEQKYKGRQTTLWIIGESKTAKTNFAQSIGRYIHIKGSLNSDKIHKYRNNNNRRL
jgi:hypothetical protein